MVVDEVLFRAESLVSVLVTAVGDLAGSALHPLASFHALDDQEHTLGRELAGAVQVDRSGDGLARHVHWLVRVDEAVVAAAETASHVESDRPSCEKRGE